MKYRFERYCKDYENIENYEKALADNFKNWEVHHRLETHNSDGERRLVDITADELLALGMYWYRPASELIFMKHSEHQFLHHKGKQKSEETKNKLRTANIGEKNPMYGKKHSDAAKKKMSEKAKGNIKTKGTRWYNNGKINTMAKECPDGFVPGRIKKP